MHRKLVGEQHTIAARFACFQRQRNVSCNWPLTPTWPTTASTGHPRFETTQIHECFDGTAAPLITCRRAFGHFQKFNIVPAVVNTGIPASPVASNIEGIPGKVLPENVAGSVKLRHVFRHMRPNRSAASSP